MLCKQTVSVLKVSEPSWFNASVCVCAVCAERDGPTSRHRKRDRERGAEEETEEISVCVEVWLPYLTNELVLTQRKSELILATLDPDANTNSVWQLHIHWLPPSTPTLFINSLGLSVGMSFCVYACVYAPCKKYTRPCHLNVLFHCRF